MSYREPRPLPPGQRLAPGLEVRTYGRVPSIAPQCWTLHVTGGTADGDRTVTWDDLLAMDHVEVEADLHCVSRTTTQDLRWSGVPARELVSLCPPDASSEHVLAVGQHGYSATMTLGDLVSPRTLFATHLDGAPLTAEHGAPVRLVVPHLYGFKGPKWVREIVYTEFPERGFWEQRGYHVRGDAWRQERYAYQE